MASQFRSTLLSTRIKGFERSAMASYATYLITYLGTPAHRCSLLRPFLCMASQVFRIQGSRLSAPLSAPRSARLRAVLRQALTSPARLCPRARLLAHEHGTCLGTTDTNPGQAGLSFANTVRNAKARRRTVPNYHNPTSSSDKQRARLSNLEQSKRSYRLLCVQHLCNVAQPSIYRSPEDVR